jgi:hypothetical protein
LRATIHRLTDLAASRVLRAHRYYPDGFGDRGALHALASGVESLTAAEPEPEIDVEWHERRALFGVEARVGRFRSPSEDVLPTEGRDAVVELLLPRGAVRPPVVVVFAATAEEGFARRRLLTLPLVRRGIGALLLENPFYGVRRPPGQRDAVLRTVAEQFAMNVATVREGRALAAWLSREGHPVALTGFSQGGMMAAFVAALSPFRVAAIPCASALSADAIFLEGTLTDGFDWPRLARDAGDLPAAQKLFAECLAPVNLARFGPPVAPELAIVLAGRHDAFVPAREPVLLHRHWPGSELRWLAAGHVTSAVLHQRAHRRAVRDAVARMSS